MKQRCYNQRAQHFFNYGGRGIKIFPEWIDNPLSFISYVLETLGERPHRYSLDRIDNDGNYEPGNLRWADQSTQMINSRHSRKLTAFGETLCLSQWSKRFNLGRNTLYGRLKKGQSAEQAIQGLPSGARQWALIRWRGCVASAVRGKRGQSLLTEMLAALDAMPEKKLIAEELIQDGNVCALGALGLARGLDMAKVDPEQYDQVAALFGVAEPLVREIESINDDSYYGETPNGRWARVREWVASQIKTVEGV